MAGGGRGTSANRWAWAAVGSALTVAAVYVLAVLTPGGQALENAALRGADQVQDGVFSEASQALGQITVITLALATAVIAEVGLFRRRWDLAVAGVAVIVAGQVLTQGLKRFVLPRPELIPVTGDFTSNSFPSGHTTIAMTVLFAALIVTSYRWRGVVLFATLAWSVGIGAYTITAKWHRFSDTLGADAIALLCACAASWWLARRGSLVEYGGQPRRGRIAIAVLLAAGGVTTTALGAFLWVVPALRGTDHTVIDTASDYTAYLGAHSLAAGASALTALAFWALWHRTETVLPARHRTSER